MDVDVIDADEITEMLENCSDEERLKIALGAEVQLATKEFLLEGAVHYGVAPGTIAGHIAAAAMAVCAESALEGDLVGYAGLSSAAAAYEGLLDKMGAKLAERGLEWPTKDAAFAALEQDLLNSSFAQEIFGDEATKH